MNHSSSTSSLSCGRQSYLEIVRQVLAGSDDQQQSTPSGSSIKHLLVEIDYHGHVWLVADEADAREVVSRGGTRGECVTSGELEMIGRIDDEASRDEVLAFKRGLNARVSSVVDHRKRS